MKVNATSGPLCKGFFCEIYGTLLAGRMVSSLVKPRIEIRMKPKLNSLIYFTENFNALLEKFVPGILPKSG